MNSRKISGVFGERENPGSNEENACY